MTRKPFLRTLRSIFGTFCEYFWCRTATATKTFGQFSSITEHLNFLKDQDAVPDFLTWPFDFFLACRFCIIPVDLIEKRFYFLLQNHKHGQVSHFGTCYEGLGPHRISGSMYPSEGWIFGWNKPSNYQERQGTSPWRRHLNPPRVWERSQKAQIRAVKDLSLCYNNTECCPFFLYFSINVANLTPNHCTVQLFRRAFHQEDRGANSSVYGNKSKLI